MNKDNYKNAINQIHASDELKQKTLEKMKQKKNKKISYMKYLSVAAVIVLVFGIGFNKLEKRNIETPEIPIATATKKDNKGMENELPRFKDIEELKEVLSEREAMYSRTTNGIAYNAMEESVKSDSVTLNESATPTEDFSKQKDYSTTNVQV